MISFDLKCAHHHVFEAWFRSSADYDAQRASALIVCPVCGNADVDKAVMAPAVGAKSNQRSLSSTGEGQAVTMIAEEASDEAKRAAMIAALAETQARMLERSEWVGDKFAEKARAMHKGETPSGAIHGTARPDEARAMMEEGLPVLPLVVPVAPPDQTH